MLVCEILNKELCLIGYNRTLQVIYVPSERWLSVVEETFADTPRIYRHELTGQTYKH